MTSLPPSKMVMNWWIIVITLKVNVLYFTILLENRFWVKCNWFVNQFENLVQNKSMYILIKNTSCINTYKQNVWWKKYKLLKKMDACKNLISIYISIRIQNYSSLKIIVFMNLNRYNFESIKSETNKLGIIKLINDGLIQNCHNLKSVNRCQFWGVAFHSKLNLSLQEKPRV